jgi:DNA-binding SARP family transcriptional activator/basic membrane lipoprotein Med (substrate-binding protein (PBP1-ABC) superfamily)
LQPARQALPPWTETCFATDVTKEDRVIEFRVLGPLEVWAGARLVSVGGPKPQAVLALLLLQADEVVSVERLIDEVWGELPPPSAAHSLETYVSRLRSALAGLGPELVRQGAGYSLRLNQGRLDSRTFAALADEASEVATNDDHERSAELAARALALWRGPAVADVALGSSGRVEAERLEELRLRVLEQRIDAELALGREESLIAELQVLVAQNPYRERFVAQLMLALYRAGRHADALEVYAKTRGALDEVGLQPSSDLQQLSGKIVRQEPQLSRPVQTLHQVADPHARSKARSVGLALAATLALAMAVSASGSGPRPASASAARPSPTRVALVLPRSPASDEAMRRYRDGVRLSSSVMNPKLTSETVVARSAPTSGALNGLETRLRNGRFGLVIWATDDIDAHGVARVVKALPSTRFVFMDASVEALSLQGVANASAVRFAVEQTTELVGYLSGLVPPRDRPSHERADIVGVVGGIRTPQAERNLAAFRRGLEAALPQAKVLVDYANETVDRTRCEQIANSQIDRGADVVFALAGRCGSGALAVARTRGIWGAGDSDSASQPADSSSDLLVRMHKEYEMAINNALTRFLEHSLPRGSDLVLGLNDNYAIGLSTSWAAPEAAVSKMIDRCSTIRRRAYVDA